MMNKTKNGLAASLAVERPRYFPRQLITPDDMTMEQRYFRDRLRLHNLMLHGWGVVCGALVVPVTNGEVVPWKVRVCPGYILGPQGDEIIIACDHEVDLRQGNVAGTAADPCGASRDPWCSDVWIEREPDAAYYIAVKYQELAVRPQRIQPAGCGCDESRCEFSRWRDGYEIGVLTEAEYKKIRAASATPLAWNELFQTPNNNNPACGLAPQEPWVVLAQVKLDSEGRPTMIDNCTYRRLVAAFRHFYWTCSVEATVAPGTVNRGGVNEGLTFTGEGFQEGLTVVLGPGISVGSFNWDDLPTAFTIEVNVAEDAPTGPRTVMIVNPDCSFARATLTVGEGSEAGEAGASRAIREEEYRDRLRANLKAEAMNALEAAGDLSAALERPATDIIGVGRASPLTSSDLTIGGVSAMTVEAFIETLGVADDETEREEARIVYAKARMIRETVASLKRR